VPDDSARRIPWLEALWCCVGTHARTHAHSLSLSLSLSITRPFIHSFHAARSLKTIVSRHLLCRQVLYRVHRNDCAVPCLSSLFHFFYKLRVFKKLRLFQHLEVCNSFSARRLLRVSSGAELVFSTLQLLSMSCSGCEEAAPHSACPVCSSVQLWASLLSQNDYLNKAWKIFSEVIPLQARCGPEGG